MRDPPPPAPERATLAQLLAEDSPESREALRLLDAHLLMGVLLGRQGQCAEGARLLRQALQELPGNEVMLLNLCGLLLANLSKDRF